MIRAIRTTVQRAEAADILESAAPVSAEVERKLFYPFRWLSFRCSARTLMGKSSLRVSCLVDARRRLCATVGPFEAEMVATSHEDVLEPILDELEGRRIAERYVTYAVTGRRKALASFELDVLGSSLVYKPFWIARCAGRDSSRFRVLVDGATGGFYPIPDAASRS